MLPATRRLDASSQTTRISRTALLNGSLTHLESSRLQPVVIWYPLPDMEKFEHGLERYSPFRTRLSFSNSAFPRPFDMQMCCFRDFYFMSLLRIIHYTFFKNTSVKPLITWCFPEGWLVQPHVIILSGREILYLKVLLDAYRIFRNRSISMEFNSKYWVNLVFSTLYFAVYNTARLSSDRQHYSLLYHFIGIACATTMNPTSSGDKAAISWSPGGKSTRCVTSFSCLNLIIRPGMLGVPVTFVSLTDIRDPISLYPGYPLLMWSCEMPGSTLFWNLGCPGP